MLSKLVIVQSTLSFVYECNKNNTSEIMHGRFACQKEIGLLIKNIGMHYVHTYEITKPLTLCKELSYQ